MSEKFVVPEPSREAVECVANLFMSYLPNNNRPNSDSDRAAAKDFIQTAYRRELPRIVRAEVERALRFFEIMGAGGGEYLAARFPEAAPEGSEPCPHGRQECVECRHLEAPTLAPEQQCTGPWAGCPHCVPTPSARTVAAELNDRLEPTINAGLPKCETCGEALLFSVRNGYRKHECRLWMTPPERDFLRALAAKEAADYDLSAYNQSAHPRVAEAQKAVWDAASRVTEEAGPAPCRHFVAGPPGTKCPCQEAK